MSTDENIVLGGRAAMLLLDEGGIYPTGQL